jgi:putative endonuclease
MPARKKNKKNKKKRSPPKGPFVCYCIENDGSVYTGISNNFARRIRQHNGELSGGARYTKRKLVTATQRWTPMFHIRGLKTLRHALQLEAALKKRHVPVAFLRVGNCASKKKKRRTRGPGGRVRQIEYILSLGRINDEPHGCTHSGLSVHCFIPKERYLELAGDMSNVTFEATRCAQEVPFTFQ